MKGKMTHFRSHPPLRFAPRDDRPCRTFQAFLDQTTQSSDWVRMRAFGTSLKVSQAEYGFPPSL